MHVRHGWEQASLSHQHGTRSQVAANDARFQLAQMAGNPYLYWSFVMKKLLAISFAAVLAGCGGGSDDDAGSTASAAANATGATSNSSAPAASSNPAASSTSDTAAAAASRAFLISAYQDGTAEIALSNLALQNASDADVKIFAQRMIEDHTLTNTEIRQLAQAKNISLPTDITPENRTALQTMTSLSGIEFDRAYMAHNVTVHAQDVAEFRQQALSATDADIRTFAANNLPALQVHLLSAKGIHGKINPAAYLMNAFQDGNAEILLSTLALQKATGPLVREFAQHMIDEHTRANTRITQLAQAKNITLPTDVGVEHQAAYDDLTRMSGADFDKAFMNHNLLVHALDVAQTRAQAENGTDPDIRAFAAGLLPELTEHLQVAVQIHEEIKPSLLFAAYQDGAGEILLSKLALQKASDAEVQQFAQRMITDHTSANTQVMQLAQAKNIALPTEVSAEQAVAYVRLSLLSGPGFDTAYMDRNIEVHAKDVEHFREHAENDPDADIRAFAAQQLPVLTAHLQSATQIRGRLNSTSP
jgi:predicted outer membrane protein